MSLGPHSLGNQWPVPKVRWNGTQEREQCEKCGRWCVISGIGRHRYTCTGELARDKSSEVPHMICGLNGCPNLKRIDAPRCYSCSEPEGRMDELDRANGWGKYKAKALENS